MTGPSDELSERIDAGPHSAGVISTDGRWRWDGRAWQVAPAPQKSRDVLVKLAAYAAFAGAGVSLFNEVLTFVFIRELRDPSNAALAPTFQSIHDIAYAVGWALLVPVGVGLYRIALPPSTISKVGLGTAIAGVTVVVLSSLVSLVTARSATDLPLPQITEAGQIVVAIWLVLTNSELRSRGFLSRWLTLAGIAFGVGVAWTSIGLLTGSPRFLGISVALLVPFGFLIWQPWLGVALLRPLPVAET